MENKPIEPTSQDLEAQQAPVSAVEVTETPEQTAEKVEIAEPSVETTANVAKIEEEKPGFGMKLRKGLMKAAALVGIGGALAGGATLASDTRHEAPQATTTTSDTIKDPSADILANPNLPEVLKNAPVEVATPAGDTEGGVKEAANDINANPNLPQGLKLPEDFRAGAPTTSAEASPGVAADEVTSGNVNPSLPREFTPGAASSVPTSSGEVYTIPLPNTPNNAHDMAPSAQNNGVNNGRVVEDLGK